MLNSRDLNQMLTLLKKVNNALVKQVALLECECWRNVQNSRRECEEIIAIPTSIHELTVSFPVLI